MIRHVRLLVAFLVACSLALAGGSFLYLGYHAIHGEIRRSGTSPAMQRVSAAPAARHW